VTRTLVDLASVLPERAVERALDRADALRVLDMTDVLHVLREGASRPGCSADAHRARPAPDRHDTDGHGPRGAVEADGDAWHRTRRARQHDRRRDVALANAGWMVLRFADADIVLDPGYVVAAIRTTLAQRSST
jgi:hypothetical protein